MLPPRKAAVEHNSKVFRRSLSLDLNVTDRHWDFCRDHPSSEHDDLGLGDRQLKSMTVHPSVDPKHHLVEVKLGQLRIPSRDDCGYVVCIADKKDIPWHLEAKQSVV